MKLYSFLPKVQLGIFVLFLLSPLIAQNIDTLWIEDWEDDWVSSWYVDGGTWEVGNITSGPGSAFSEEQCAGTVIDGNYPEGVRSRLIRIPKITVPSADLNPRLRFWHWFSMSSSDYGYVQVKTENQDWQNVSVQYFGSCSAVWTQPSIDLSSFADSTIQIAFYFHSDNYAGGSADVSSGWYIDDVCMVSGDYVLKNFDDFETGLSDWASECGTWQVGTVSSGPDTVFSGKNCAATSLNGNYSEGVRSRLVSPPIIIPTVEENPRLRFWHWFSLSSSDYCYVQIRTENQDWRNLSVKYFGSCSNVWSYTELDLSLFADSTVQIAFYFHSDNYAGGSADVSSGWYIDDFQIVTGEYEYFNPETFENGIGDWSAERGTWEVGVPECGGAGAYSGDNCISTNLAGNYSEGVRSHFVSPPFKVKSVDENPSLRFWHYFLFSSSDFGEVHIKTENSEWVVISDRFSGNSGTWTNYYYDLSDYADSLVQVGFYFHSDNYAGGSADVNCGWFIDDVMFSEQVTFVNREFLQKPERFQLLQNYPNPFNPVTTIEYAVGANQDSPVKVDLSVYNLLGQKVVTLVSKKQPAGNYKVDWNASLFSNGIYYYQLKADQFSQTRKMILIK